MPRSAWAWTDANGTTCRYCDPPEFPAQAFPNDMLNQNGELSIEDLVQQVRQSHNGRYDCLVSITGGRDSTFVLYYTKAILGLNPLAFNYDTGFLTDIARSNMTAATSKLGVDFVQYSLNPKLAKKLARGLFVSRGEVCSLCHQGYFYTVSLITKWTGLKHVVRGLCVDTEANRGRPSYIDWYCLTDEEFNAAVDAFPAAERISHSDIENNREFFYLRREFNHEIVRIDLPDMLEYTHDGINSVLTALDWQQDRFFIHSDCLFAPILVCCQRIKDGYSKKHVNISNLAIAGLDHNIVEKLLAQEEYVDFDSIPEVIDDFVSRLEIDRPSFDRAINGSWRSSHD